MTDAVLKAMRTQLLNEVKAAEAGLSKRTLAAEARYSNALYELDKLERLIHRMELDRQQVDAAAY